jgi:hypothetical protein
MRKTFFALLTLSIGSLLATPTSIFWTNCTTDVVAKEVFHIDVDNYFSLGNRTKNGSSFPPDVGLTYGLFSWDGIGSEIGADYMGGIKNPWLFNGKLALTEDILFQYAPSISVGFFDLGTAHDTNLGVIDAVIGRTLPWDMGRLFLGLFHGKRALGKHRSGWMAGYEKSFCSKWQFLADYSSGKNLNGGGGFAVAYYFTPKISLETGPVWFRDTANNGRWKWSLQLDIDI